MTAERPVVSKPMQTQQMKPVRIEGSKNQILCLPANPYTVSSRVNIPADSHYYLSNAAGASTDPLLVFSRHSA